jgi:hypothetical protein
MKPVLLVDVDGVLNCFGSLWTPEYEAEHFEPLRVAYDRYTIRCRKGLADNLARLAEWFEMTWCTAWEGNAHPFFGEWLGLGHEPWPHVDWTRGWVGEELTWKLADVRRVHDGDRPLAWIDDDLGPDAYEWAKERNQAGAPTLLVKTNPCDGLTDKHVDQLIYFAEEVSRPDE